MWFFSLCLLGVVLNTVHSEKAQVCKNSICEIPSCRCASTDIPNGFKNDSVPQIVLLTFDDAVSALLYSKYYEPMLNLRNPNGCPIGMTFFVSHEYCDYTLVHDLWTRGHEIADHSISHKAEQSYWSDNPNSYDTWVDEFVGMRDMLEKFAYVPKQQVKGIRVPFLRVGGNTQFKMMQAEGFFWDCSMSKRTAVPGTWPYNLKYKGSQDCQVGKCPDDSFPSVWAIPMLNLFTSDNIPCAMLDTCIVKNESDTYDLLMRNFLKQYHGNRAPFGLYTHAAWFLQQEYHYTAYRKFIDKILEFNDVYIVTVSQALDYTRYPVTLSEIKDYSPWKTQCTKKENTCGNGRVCRCMKEEPWGQSERYMNVCGSSCPNTYPWVGNPLGENGTPTCE